MLSLPSFLHYSPPLAKIQFARVARHEPVALMVFSGVLMPNLDMAKSLSAVRCGLPTVGTRIL